MLFSLLLLPLLFVSASAETKEATVYFKSGSYVVDERIDSQFGCAYGSFEDNLNITGWGILNVWSSKSFPDKVQSECTGVLEGYLTASHIYTTFLNLQSIIFPNQTSPPPAVTKFLDDQELWVRATVVSEGPIDPFWNQVGILMSQYDGLSIGYRLSTSAPPLSHFAFQMLNGVGDLFDIIPAVEPKQRVDWLALRKTEAEELHGKSGHCSGLIKTTGNFSDLFMAHSSWFTFTNTNRIFKHYHFQFSRRSQTAAQNVSFSSYPGFLESLDDFYMLSSGLGWTQTTNTVLDHSVYDSVKPQSLLAWQRVRVASSMAKSGQEWYLLFSRNHSGTYANQYMIVDFNLFTPDSPLSPGTLWVVEEMPGLVVGEDRTETLSRGYWPSYNVPYFTEVYKRSGYPAMVAKFGNYFTYELAPRAQIFRRDQGSVGDMVSLKQLMRYNDYLHDPYSFDGTRQNPAYAICSRYDLAASNNPSPGGCYDTKATSYKYGAQDRKAQAINGPTRSIGAGNLPPFSWVGNFTQHPHLGLPALYEFDFIDIFPLP